MVASIIPGMSADVLSFVITKFLFVILVSFFGVKLSVGFGCGVLD